MDSEGVMQSLMDGLTKCHTLEELMNLLKGANQVLVVLKCVTSLLEARYTISDTNDRLANLLVIIQKHGVDSNEMAYWIKSLHTARRAVDESLTSTCVGPASVDPTKTVESQISDLYIDRSVEELKESVSSILSSNKHVTVHICDVLTNEGGNKVLAVLYYDDHKKGYLFKRVCKGNVERHVWIPSVIRLTLEEVLQLTEDKIKSEATIARFANI